MKTIVLVVVVVIFSALGFWIGYSIRLQSETGEFVSPLDAVVRRPLDKYSIESLQNSTFGGSTINLETPVATESMYTSYRFSFITQGKRATGIANIPKSSNSSQKFPVIVQIRGYIDPASYRPGDGTRRSGEMYASKGFITLAPDFLGFGDSDMPSGDIFEERFERYTTILDLLASIPTMPAANSARIGIWGHSNGGQIALTILEILGKPLPTTLWAPVTRPFPYSILYYTDEADDYGKALRKSLSAFETLYDTDKYSIHTYVDRLAGPIIIHQGTADEAVPKKWSDEFVQDLTERGKEIEYFSYPGADHNMLGAWNTVVERDIEFFTKYLKAK